MNIFKLKKFIFIFLVVLSGHAIAMQQRLVNINDIRQVERIAPQEGQTYERLLGYDSQGNVRVNLKFDRNSRQLIEIVVNSEEESATLNPESPEAQRWLRILANAFEELATPEDWTVARSRVRIGRKNLEYYDTPISSIEFAAPRLIPVSPTRSDARRFYSREEILRLRPQLTDS